MSCVFFRTRLIVGVGSRSITGSLREVLSNHGWRGLWRGNGINAFRSAPVQAIELSTFEFIKNALKSAHKRWAIEGPPQVNVMGQVVKLNVGWVPPSMLAGAVAGVVSTVSCYPLEVLKVHTYITISTPLIPTFLQPNHSRIELFYQV
jgi:solute carrier family 25 phosphate transporter 23/24/25/41